ncbi:hypothetical protein [Krasilnikovia sp. MM14-A1259]|uniref:hypothetical protein n=1 Tax=Krasilnikovia sp. MM14-A1259 TaxID=3373539 RepID=UPI00399D02EC
MPSRLWTAAASAPVASISDLHPTDVEQPIGLIVGVHQVVHRSANGREVGDHDY